MVAISANHGLQPSSVVGRVAVEIEAMIVLPLGALPIEKRSL